MKMTHIFLFSFFLLFISPSYIIALELSTGDQCMDCHSDLGDELQAPADKYKFDIHFLKGITCAGCHGGNPSTDDMDEGMSEENGFIGIPLRIERFKTCIRCHSSKTEMQKFGSDLPVNQYEILQSSIHLKTTFDNRGPIADCITCHSVHNIAKVDNPNSKVYPTKIVLLCGSCHSDANYMKNYNPGLPVDQVAKYKTSIHGIQNSRGDANVAECASCHGGHEIKAVEDPRSLVYATNIPGVCSECHSEKTLMAKYNLPTDQYDSFVESVHGIALFEKQDVGSPSCNDCHGNHGAVPPGVESISKVCGTCHVLNLELFEKSPHKKAFIDNNYPECESCHSNHQIKHATDEMIGIQEGSACLQCHEEQDDNDGYYVAKTMKHLLDSLKFEESNTKEILSEASQKGMDISEAEFSLKDIRQILIQTRTSVHTFNLEQFKQEIIPGYTIAGKSKTEGIAAIDDYYFRRQGLAVSTIIVTILIIGLYIKLKKLDKKAES
ncbi:MAG: cytochrome c3 family protein [Ignavibacteria bacterium]|jgi:hypothetical protein